MTKDPEQVLPKKRVSALRDFVETGAEKAVELKKNERDRDHGKGEHDEELHDERHPREYRHAHEVHAWRAHVDDRRDEVESRGERRHAEDLQPKNPEIDVEILRIRQRRERSVAEPAAIRRRSHEP